MSNIITLEQYVLPEFVFLDYSFKTQEDLFKKIYSETFERGYVREDFLERIKLREGIFPTGLQLEDMGVAIPHTDSECILKEFVAIVTTDSVEFKSMENINQSVSVKIVFVLGLNEPHAQLEMLQSLMRLLQNKEILANLIGARTPEEVIKLIKNNQL